MTKRAWIITAGVVLLAVVWRATLFGVSVRTVPAFDDECKIALQAKQIAHGAHPLLILASPYVFPVEAYLMAPFIHFLPRNAFGARIMALGFGLLTLIVSLLILKRWGSWKDTWPGIALVLFPSVYLLTLQIGCAMPGYPTLLLLGACTIWLALWHSEASRGLWLLAFLSGFCAGLAASETMLSLPFLLMSGLMIAVARNWSTALLSAPAYAAGTLVGLLPHFLARHRYTGAFEAVSQSVSGHTALHKILSPTLDRTLPAAFGWRAPIFPDTPDSIPWLAGCDLYIGLAILALLAILTLINLWSFLRRWHEERWPRVDVGLVFSGIAWINFVLFVFSLRSNSHSYRYLVPLVWSFPFLLTDIYRRSRLCGRWALGAVTVLFLLVNFTATPKALKCWSAPGFSDTLKSYDLKPAFRYLEQRGINRCYSAYTDAYRITYGSDGRIICCQPFNERFRGWPVPFKEMVDAATNAAFVLSDSYHFQPSDFEKDLAAMHIVFRKTPCGHFDVYTDFGSPFPPSGTRIPPESIRITTSEYPQGAKALHDGDYVNRWRSHKTQEKGMWIEISLPSKRTVSELVLYYNGYRSDRARAMRLLVWNGQIWTPVKEHISNQLDVFDFINNHPVYQDTKQTIRLSSVTTDRLRLEIEEAEPNHDWAIGEICVCTADHQPSEARPASAPDSTIR